MSQSKYPKSPWLSKVERYRIDYTETLDSIKMCVSNNESRLDFFTPAE